MTAEEYFDKGYNCHNKGDYKEAIEYYNKTIELDPNYIEVYCNRGAAKCILKEYKAAIKDYNKAIELDSNYAIAYCNRGLLRRDLKDYKGAIEDFNYALQLNFEYAEAYNGLGAIKSDLKDYQGAITCYNKAIELDSHSTSAYNNRGSAKIELKDYKSAIKDFNKAIELDPNNATAYCNRATLRRDLKDYKGAIEDINFALQLNFEYAEAYNGLGTIKNDLNDYQGAITCYNKAIELDSHSTSAYNNRGNAKRELKDYESAIKDYNKAIELNPNYTHTYNNRGILKYRLKDYEGSIEDYNKTIELDPTYSLAYNSRGNSKFYLKEYDGAIKDYDEAIDINPDFALAWGNKSIAHYHQKQYDIALCSAFRSSFLGYNFFEDQDIIYFSYSIFPFFIFRQIQNNLPLNQYKKYADTIQTARKDCMPLYTFIIQQSIHRTNNYNKDIWQRWLGNINYYCGDPIVSHAIFKSFVDQNSKTLSDYYYLIQSCFDFVEDADPYIGNAILTAEQVRDEDYNHPKASNPHLHFPLLQQYYAGLIFEIDEESEDALLCFEKIAAYFLPAKYKQMQLLYDLEQKEASETIRKEIIGLERGLSSKTGFLRGLPKHTFNLKDDKIEKLFPHYFHYLEIEPAVTHLANLSKKDTDLEIQYPGNQRNFWELFKVNPKDLDATRKKANVVPLLDLYKTQIEEYSCSFDPNNKPASIQEDNAFRQTFKTLDALDNKAELQLELGLHIQDFSLPYEQYEELSTYFFVKGYLNNYEKLILDFYTAYLKFRHQKVSPFRRAGVEEVIESVTSKHLGHAVGIISGSYTFANFPPLVAFMISSSLSVGVNFAAGYISELCGKFFQKNQTKTIKTFQEFKTEFEQFIAQEKERLGDKFVKRYPIQELYK